MNLSKLVRVALLAVPLALAVTLFWGHPAQATPGASIFCEAVSTHGGVCEAWPQGEGFTYAWSTTGTAFLSTPAPPTAAIRQVACIPSFLISGAVQVTVTAPNGTTSSVSVTVCRPLRDEPVIRLPP